jgi:hypothetical protein
MGPGSSASYSSPSSVWAGQNQAALKPNIGPPYGQGALSQVPPPSYSVKAPPGPPVSIPLPSPPPYSAQTLTNTVSPIVLPPPYEGDEIQVGFYRDGANDLDAPDSIVDDQIRAASRHDRRIHVNVEDTTSLLGNGAHTYFWTVNRGIVNNFRMEPFHDMSGRAELANFVASTLDQAYIHHRKHVWLFFVDHGAADAGVNFTQEPDGSIQHSSLDTLRGGLNDGIAMHKARFPQDTNAHIEGIVMHECFMATIGVAETLSAVGVKYLYATSETSIAPGIPGGILHEIAEHVHNPQAQGKAVVDEVMNTAYVQKDRSGKVITYHPVANFMMLDLDPQKINAMKMQQRKLNRDLLYYIGSSPIFRSELLEDINSVQGMERDQKPKPGKIAERIPWTSDRPSVAVYAKIANDKRLPSCVRNDAALLYFCILATIIYHVESVNFEGFGADYRDAGSPTIHFPTSIPDINPSAPSIRETDAAESDLNGQNAVISQLLAPTYPAQAILA